MCTAPLSFLVIKYFFCLVAFRLRVKLKINEYNAIMNTQFRTNFKHLRGSERAQEMSEQKF